jgi:NitT/TauT family transport system ATP-binding protein
MNAHVRSSEGTPVSATTPMLSFDRLSLAYRSKKADIVALRDLTLHVDKGEFVSVLGPSGCGKSTLLKIAAGLLKPTAGSIKLAGVPVSGPSREVGIVFQQPTLLPWKTVIENVLVPVRALKLPMAEYRPRASELLQLIGLGEFADRYPHELSGGMQQRVGIARGLVHDPKVLLMDEPFAALDAMTREFMMGELQSIWIKTRKSVLFITHSIPEAAFLSDRVVTLSGRPGSVVDNHLIELRRPRDLSIMSQPVFGEQCGHLRQLFDSASAGTTLRNVAGTANGVGV